MTLLSALAAEDDDVWLVLARLHHPALDDAIRVVNDNEDLTVSHLTLDGADIGAGGTYLACPFEVVLPSDSDTEPPRARVRIDNVAQDIAIALRSIDSALSVDFYVVRRAAPQVVEQRFGGLSLRDATVTATTVTGSVGLDDLRLEAFPAHAFSPTHFPGLFA